MLAAAGCGVARGSSHAEPVAGKVAIVLGASSGIGSDASRVLADAGIHVVLAARRKDRIELLAEKIREGGGAASAIQCDVSCDEDVAKAFRHAEDTYGGVDLVFANAGVEGNAGTRAHELATAAELELVTRVNFMGTGLLALKHAVPALRKRGGGAIAFSSSMSSLLNSHSFALLPQPLASSLIAYTASKAGLDAVVRAAAGTYTREGIRCYGLNIGIFDSEMMDRHGGVSDSVGFNPVFKGSYGRGADVGALLLSLVDGTTAWPPGSQLVVDNDGTFSAKLLHDAMHAPGPDHALGWPDPETLRPHVRDVTGRRPHPVATE